MNIAGLCNVEIHRAVASQKTRIMCHASIVNFTIARTSQSSNILRIFCHFMSSCFSFFPVKSPKKSFLRYTSKWLSAPCCREQECFNSVKPIQFEIWSVKHSSTTKAKSSPTGKKEYLGTGSVTDSRCTTGLHRLSPALLLPSAPSFLPWWAALHLLLPDRCLPACLLPQWFAAMVVGIWTLDLNDLKQSGIYSNKWSSERWNWFLYTLCHLGWNSATTRE